MGRFLARARPFQLIIILDSTTQEHVKAKNRTSIRRSELFCRSGLHTCFNFPNDRPRRHNSQQRRCRDCCYARGLTDSKLDHMSFYGSVNGAICSIKILCGGLDLVHSGWQIDWVLFFEHECYSGTFFPSYEVLRIARVLATNLYAIPPFLTSADNTTSPLTPPPRTSTVPEAGVGLGSHGLWG